MATPPTTDPATQAFGSGSPEPSPIRRLAGHVRLPHAKRHRSTPRRVALAVLAGFATLLVLLTLDGIWAGRAMFRGVSGARGALIEGAVAVTTGDPGASVPHFEHAAESADSALSASGHPAIALASRLPWIGDNLDAVAAVAEASRRSADAGLAMAEAARILGWQDLRLPSVESIGDVDLPALRRAAPALDEVATELGVALAELESIETRRLLGPVATGYEDAVETLERRAKIALDTRDIVDMLPGFLGGGTDRRYLLAVQTLGRPQGTGGEIDLIGVLSASNGRLSLEEPLAPAGEPFVQATATNSGRAAGENLLAAARDAGLGEMDAVVLTDSLWLADTVWTTGTVDVPDRALPVNSDQAAKVLEREVFEDRDLPEAAARRAEVATAIVEAYLSRRPATEAFAVALARDVAERHLVVVSTLPRERRLFERLGAGGVERIAGGEHALAVTWDTAVDNHAAVFARRDISHRVTLGDDGSAKVRTVVTLVNEAPDEPPSALLGFPLPATVADPAEVDPVGGWAADVGVVVPPRSDRVTAETSVPSETQTLKEDGVTTLLGRLSADPGDSMSLLVGYRVADARLEDGIYRLHVVPQPAWPAGTVRLQIDAPPGALIAEASDELEVGGASARFVGEPTKPFNVWIRFA